MFHTQTLAGAQRLLELKDAEEGAIRYYDKQDFKAQREGFERRDDVQKMIRGALPLVSASLADWVAKASEKKGRPSAALAPLKELDPDVVALVALSKTFAGIAKASPLITVAIGIGRSVQVEVEARLIGEADPKAAKKFEAMAEGAASERSNLKAHERLKEALEIGLEWSSRTQALVGGTVLNALLKALPGMFYKASLADEKGAMTAIKLTEEALEQIADMAEAAAWSRPLLRPMIAPPRPWTHYDTGAYIELQLSRTVPLVRTYNREHQKLLREAIKDGSMQPVLDSVNLLQNTRFAIDTRVLEVMQWVWDGDHRPSQSFPLPAALQPALVAKMSDEEWEGLSKEGRSATSRRRKTVRDIRSASTVNGSVFKSDLAEAYRLAAVEAFYLPHSLDSRGRVYAVPYFNPQRSDHIKALFRFADPAPYGSKGGYWLSIHLANCGDFKLAGGYKTSKAPFPERVQWVKDNEEQILQVAQDPEGTYGWWKDADSPFCFLQACFEYAGWAQSGYSEAFEGYISVALDGSCSGLQHYSAMNRSAEEGYHVNLLPRETVGDIYNVVCDQARPGLETLAGIGDEAAGIIIANGFGRNDVKRNVMTYFYGSGKFGMRDQHIVDTMRPLADRVALGELSKHPYDMLVTREDKETGESVQRLDGGFTCAQTLAAHIHKAVVDVAPKADQASSWFQGVAALLAHESLPVIWRTPMGMPVLQRYSEYTSKAVNMWLYNSKVHVPENKDDKVDEDGNVLQRVTCLLREAPTKRIDKKKARSAISPNVVHSLDAAHLQRVAVMAGEEGIRHFQFIHDSFATHAGRTERFFGIIREAFVAQYETYCPFEALTEYAMSVLSEEGREKLAALAIPERGTLDLREVLASRYAFA